ncbi:MAG TPA: thiol:disulfide interchange protein DsbA/DsbL [Steroidobacteraceae bacterium]|nr:thiol:disulfide interchange protein DsbA/DsbL [Steroidobacteraceae bacterium]
MKTAIRLVFFAALSFAAAVPQAAEPVEGKDYFLISPAVPTSDASKVVVTEYFSYQCPHCFTFAKPFAAWSAGLPKDVKADRAAVSIGHATWVAAGQAFYALTAMKAVPAIDDAFFGAIHRERRKLNDEVAIAAWVAGQGIDRAAFEKAYRSFSVQLQTKRAEDQSRKVRLPSVPSLVVDGRYLVPIVGDGDFRDQLALVNALIERARRERPPTQAMSR